jgi:hypothetical protein
VYEDHIGGFDVAMHQTVPVQMRQRPGQRNSNGKTLPGRETRVSRAHFPERFGNVFLWGNFLCGFRVIRQFHHVVKVSGSFVSADVQNGNLILLRAG